MRRWKWLVALTLLLAACVSRYPMDNIETRSSVHLSSRMADCTGIHIGNGDVLTAGHCVMGFGMVVEEGPVIVKWSNQLHDTSLLFVPGLQGAPYSPLACRAPLPGENVVMIGDTAWARNIYIYGKVSTKPEVRINRRRLVLLDLRTAHGNSGAPVYDTSGQVIAMVIGMITEYGNMAVAVPSSVLCELIEGNGKITASPS